MALYFIKKVCGVSPENARRLKEQLLPGILSVGVFVNEAPEVIAELLEEGVIDAAQLHGQEELPNIFIPSGDLPVNL